MFVLVRASEGLLIAHAYLLASFVLGSTLFPWVARAQALPSAARRMVRVVCASALGLTVIGFTAFILALLHVLYPPFIVGTYILELAVAGAVTNERCWAWPFWAARVRLLAGSWDGATLVIYYLLIALAFPAVVGNVGGSDPVGYHLIYAKEWANAGSLLVDPFLRLPFYANNFLLYYATLMVFGGDVFVNYIAWCPIALAALGACATVQAILRERIDAVPAGLSAVLLTAAVLLAPSNLRWLPTAYIDGPIGAFAALFLLCLLIAIDDASFAWLIAGCVVAGFLAGMKASFILLIPFICLAVWSVSRRLDIPLRKTALVILAFLLCASPWYIRNLIVAGDPVPPILNIALHGFDGLMTKGEWHLNAVDLRAGGSIQSFVMLPLQALLHPLNLREYGTTAVILALYWPIPLLCALFATGRRLDPRLVTCSVVVLSFWFYWGFTSPWLRYSSIFFFCLPPIVALLLVNTVKHKRTVTALCIALSVIAIVPSPGSRAYYVSTYNRDYRYLATSYVSDESLVNYGTGYAEAQYAANVVKERHLAGSVFMLGARDEYFLYEDGVRGIGDWIGQAGWLRLYRAVDVRRAAQFMKDRGVAAVLIDPTKVLGGLDIPLERQLRKAGYDEIRIPGSSDVLLALARSQQ